LRAVVTTHEVSPVLGSEDVRALAGWFVDKLGFTCDPEQGIFDGVDPDEGAVYAIVVRGDARFHLQIRRHALWAGVREEIEGDVYVYVDDAYALFDEYTSRDVPMHRPISVAPYGMADFVVLTPEGHRLCFGSPVGS
jgi:hypothetical protein